MNASFFSHEQDEGSFSRKKKSKRAKRKKLEENLESIGLCYKAAGYVLPAIYMTGCIVCVPFV